MTSLGALLFLFICFFVIRNGHLLINRATVAMLLHVLFSLAMGDSITDAGAAWARGLSACCS
jgi:hypothetical protein